MQPSPEVINLSHIYACNNNNNTWSNAPEWAPNHFTKCQDTWVAYTLPGGICNSGVWRITKLQITSLETILPHHFSRHLSKSPRKSVVFKTATELKSEAIAAWQHWWQALSTASLLHRGHSAPASPALPRWAAPTRTGQKKKKKVVDKSMEWIPLNYKV